jgi:hypothetical protein
MCVGAELQGIFIRLTRKQHQVLKQMSEENKVSISSLVRLAVKDYIKEDA